MLPLLTWLLESFKSLAWPKFVARILFLVGSSGTKPQGCKGPGRLWSLKAALSTQGNTQRKTQPCPMSHGCEARQWGLELCFLDPWFVRCLPLGVPTGGCAQVLLSSRGLWEKPPDSGGSSVQTHPYRPHLPRPCPELSSPTCYADCTPRHPQGRRF